MWWATTRPKHRRCEGPSRNTSESTSEASKRSNESGQPPRNGEASTKDGWGQRETIPPSAYEVLRLSGVEWAARTERMVRNLRDPAGGGSCPTDWLGMHNESVGPAGSRRGS